MDDDRLRVDRADDVVIERARRWADTREVIDGLAPEVVLRCWQARLTATRLRGLTPRYAWTFDLTTPGDGPWDSLAHMHIGFLSGHDWVLLGHHDGDYRLVVDKLGPVHPGLRQGFVYDRRRHEADVILTMSKDQMWDAILNQIDILAVTEGPPTVPIRPRHRYT